MIVFSFLFIYAAIRILVGMMLSALMDTLRLNHIVIPPPGWKLEALELIITVVIASPIFAAIAAANQ